MKLSQKSALAFAALAVAGMSAAIPASAADLNGQDVHVDYLFPNTATLYENDGTQTVTPAGVTFTSFNTVNTTATPTQLVITFNHAGGFTPSSFNGVHFYEVGASPITFSSVTIDPSSNYAGFDLSRLSFDATNIYVNSENLNFVPSEVLTLNVNGFKPSAVPEASQFASFGVGMLGLGVLMLRTRKRRAA